MPKYYCEYCDIYLTHSSPAGRRQHNTGRKHIGMKVEYYQNLLRDPSFVPPVQLEFPVGGVIPGMPPNMMGMPGPNMQAMMMAPPGRGPPGIPGVMQPGGVPHPQFVPMMRGPMPLPSGVMPHPAVMPVGGYRMPMHGHPHMMMQGQPPQQQPQFVPPPFQTQSQAPGTARMMQQPPPGPPMYNPMTGPNGQTQPPGLETGNPMNESTNGDYMPSPPFAPVPLQTQ